MTPVRIQLSRRKGFRLQEVSRALNGLECVKVDRTTKWGNDFRGPYAVENFRLNAALPVYSGLVRAHLRGKNLACWCKESPCHADVLLEIANK